MHRKLPDIGADGDGMECRAGDVISFSPGEPHGMHAVGDDALLLLVTITPRKGAR